MPTFHTFTLGHLTCTCLSDFTRERTPRDTFPKINPAELQKEIEAGEYGIELDTPMPLHGVVLLIEDGERKIMIDSGLPTAAGGQLLRHLEAVGTVPTDIDFIIITHGDRDHIGGLANYPNAQVVLPSHSYQLWTEDAEGMVEEFIKLFRGVAPEEVLAQQAAGRRTYQDALLSLNEQGRLTLVELGEEIVPGMRFIGAAGHRRDHVAVEIKSGDAVLLHVADAFRHPIQLKRHDFYCLFDSYPDMLAESMVMLLERAAETDAIVFGAHFEFPALIKIAKNESGYEWIKM